MPVPSTSASTVKARLKKAAKRKAVEGSLGIDQITRAAHRMDHVAAEPRVELRAQPADMRLDDVGLGVEMEIPHPLEQHGARDDASGNAHQILEQGEFARLQLDALPGAAHLALEQVHLH